MKPFAISLTSVILAIALGVVLRQHGQSLGLPQGIEFLVGLPIAVAIGLAAHAAIDRYAK